MSNRYLKSEHELNGMCVGLHMEFESILFSEIQKVSDNAFKFAFKLRWNRMALWSDPNKTNN